VAARYARVDLQLTGACRFAAQYLFRSALLGHVDCLSQGVNFTTKHIILIQSFCQYRESGCLVANRLSASNTRASNSSAGGSRLQQNGRRGGSACVGGSGVTRAKGSTDERSAFNDRLHQLPPTNIDQKVSYAIIYSITLI